MGRTGRGGRAAPTGLSFVRIGRLAIFYFRWGGPLGRSDDDAVIPFIGDRRPVSPLKVLAVPCGCYFSFDGSIPACATAPATKLTL